MSASGTPNASVLPEPVGDLTSTSSPSRTSGMTIDWTANGVSMPRLASAPATASDTPSWANVEDIGSSFSRPYGEGRVMRVGRFD
jgi:hypothetical protein